MKTIYIIDDDASVRSATSFLLSGHGYSTQVFASGKEFLARTPLREGCVLLDLCMPDMDGGQVLAELTARGLDLPVVIVSGRGDIPAAVRALKGGAVDFIEKPYDETELIVAIDRAIEEAKRATDRDRGRRAAAARLQGLSQRQRQILRGVLAGMSNKEMARRLDLSPRTVEMHRAMMMTELGTASVAEAIRMAIAAELSPLEDSPGNTPTAAALAPFPGRGGAKRLSAGRKLASQELLPPVMDTLEGTTDGVYLVDRDFNITYVNRNAQEMFGLDDMVGRNLWDVFPGAARTRLYLEAHAAAEERRSARFQFFGPHLGRWLDVSIRPMAGGLQVFFHDITGTRTANAALEQGEERLRLALEASGDGAWDFDIATGRITLSPRFLARLGYAQGELDENLDAIRELIHPDDWPEVEHQLAEHLAGRSEIFACEYRLKARNGDWLWNRDRGRIVERDPGTGAPARMVGSGNDVTALKAMQERAEAANQRIALAQAGAGAGTWDLDLDEGTVRLCARALEMHGLEGDSLRELPQASWSASVHPDDFPAWKAALESAIAIGTTYSCRYRAVHPSGEVRWLLALGDAVAAADPRSRRLVGIVLDETERERTEIELRRLQNELVSAAGTNAMAAMASTFAHELNQPLAALTSYAGGLRRAIGADMEDKAHLADAIEGIESSARLAWQIVDRLKTQALHGPLERKRENLRQIVEDSARLVLAGHPEVVLAIDIADEAEWVRADRIQLQQVMINLLRNALDAMAGAPRKTIRIGAAAGGDGQVEVRIEDRGRGMAEEVRNSLFSPFVTTKPNGPGIGLSICRAVIEAHGGRIRWEPAAGGGTAICFNLEPSVPPQS
ncbi:PAS domain-containing protein [Sphingosinicella sp. CPCC 101087]|uniref:PAS domain-containing protein n=1 Tax=Sphingosinicella sp. CPCC 101087 TaxID=2497754 RepID=UPI0013ED168F|nr:PAS domain-containing protein [Sphingosinicella sp. CPCC 101087]